MARHFAKLVALAVGGVAGWQVWIQFADVFPDPWWLRWAGSGVVVVVLFPILYFPLLRPIFDIIGDRLSVTGHRFRSTRTGVGLDEIPASDAPPSRVPIVCAYCGKPGAPVCAACREKLKS